jgi:uncharacterized protein YceK
MKILKSTTLAFVATLVLSTTTGCATYRTISEAESGSPKVYSGTRLDMNTLRHDDIGVSKFKVNPPQHPLIDLPFSFVFDTAIFPLTFSVVAYEALFK